MAVKLVTGIKTSSSPDEEYFETRQRMLANQRNEALQWNGAVARLVKDFWQYTGEGEERYLEIANALCAMPEALQADMILSPKSPLGHNAKSGINARLNAWGASFLPQDMSFMDGWLAFPKFPYFRPEPATFESLLGAGLILFTTPAGVEEDEGNETGNMIGMETYARRSIASVELDLPSLPCYDDASLLFNISARGYYGAMVKIFWNGALCLPAFPVHSTPEDRTPNFWVFPPWKAGENFLDIKFVGQGFLWFDHVDVHHVVIA